MINRLRWHLHELEPELEPRSGSLTGPRKLNTLAARLAGIEGTVAALARELLERCTTLTTTINQLERRIDQARATHSPRRCSRSTAAVALTAAKIVGETAGIDRFHSPDAYARHNGTAPLPVWSSNRARHRLSRTGNRQLNAALHRIALTQARNAPRRARPSSPDAAPTATAATKRSASSNAASPTSSTEPHRTISPSPTPPPLASTGLETLSAHVPLLVDGRARPIAAPRVWPCSPPPRASPSSTRTSAARSPRTSSGASPTSRGSPCPVKDFWEFDALVTVSDPRGVENLDALDAIYHWTELIQSSPLAVERSVHGAIGGAYRSQGITTLELRFNPMKRNRGGERDLDHIILAAIRGLDRARLEYPQVRAGLILMMDRTFDARQNAIIVDKAIAWADRGVVGIDIAGPRPGGASTTTRPCSRWSRRHGRPASGSRSTSVRRARPAQRRSGRSSSRCGPTGSATASWPRATRT